MKKVKLLSVGLLMAGQSFSQHETYYIGHSGFGWDLVVGEMVNDLATDAGITTYDYNYQFIGGTCVANQWFEHASPQGGTDSWVELPTGNYDVLIMAEQIPIQEVIYGSQWCNPNIITSVEATDNFYDMAVAANPSSRIYLMEYHNEVDLTGPTPFATWSQLNSDMRPLWEQVADSVSLINPGGPEVCIVPVAAAFEAMADSVNNGSFPGFTNWTEIFDPNDLPQATIHPTEVTYYLVACVNYACIFGQSPVGLTHETFAVAGWPFDAPTPAQALMMQEIAWEVVSNDSHTCLPSTASIEEPEPFSFTVFPNPSSGIITFDFQEAGQFAVYNLLGEQMWQGEVEHQLVLNNEFVPGVYSAIISVEGGRSFHRKFVVQ